MKLKSLSGLLVLASLATTPLSHAEGSPLPASATSLEAESSLLRLNVSARVDWQDLTRDGITANDASGFKGRYFMLRADGDIAPGITYSWRQRLNKANSQQSFFDVTDWVYINYVNGNWNFQAGKEIVAIGGWEYDRAPIDLYGCSVFWNNIPCYQLGASVGYNLGAADRLTFQVCQSPFHTPDFSNLYAYNLMWNSTHGCYSAIWSANMIEYVQNRYISYIALGNKFSVGKCVLELDLMNRASSGQPVFFKDCSVMGELSFAPASAWKIHAKATYDVNHSGTDVDFCVDDGTELTMAGGGVEFYPLLNDRSALRLHANAYYSWGTNTNTADMMQSKTLYASIGLTWKMDFLNINKN